jgi:hypothetical protein
MALPEPTTPPLPESRGLSRKWKWILAICAAGAASAGVYFVVPPWISAPEVKLLIPSHSASWIRVDRQFRLGGQGEAGMEIVDFRKQVFVPEPGGSHVIWVRAFRSCQIIWDYKTTYVSNPREDEWKRPIRVDTPEFLTPGEHYLTVRVINVLGPAALQVYSDTLDLKTGTDWEATEMPRLPRRVATVDQIRLPDLSQRFPTPASALLSALPWLGPLFLAVWSGLILNDRRAGSAGTSRWLTAATCRWVVMAAWCILAANNFSRLPSDIGYDHGPHVNYIKFISDRGELPDARDGAQMFQAPLFYTIAAGIYRLLISVISSDAALIWLRWIPLCCGIAQVEICYRAGRQLFPDRDDLQSLTILVGGLLPMNLYMSQVLSNEPLSGLLSALVMLACWAGARSPATARRARWHWQVGLLCGLALLAKMSALVLAPIVAVVLATTNWPRGAVAAIKANLRCLTAAMVVSAWYYVRNFQRFGKPFIGGWDPLTGIAWWQDPGYRTPAQIVSFGQSLLHPIHSGFFSIWDGLFSTLWLDGNLSSMGTWETRPPWNETLLLSAPWPGLLLTLAIGAGVLRGLWSRDASLRHGLQIAGVTLVLYLAATLVLFLEMPAYSQAKASYTLGLIPAYAVLCVAGLDLLPQRRLLRSALTAFIITCSMAAFATYFVI